MMSFSFLQYVNPAWYFNLSSSGYHPYYPDFDKLPPRHRALLDWDEGYSHRDVSKIDAAYQAWHKGFVLEVSEAALDSQTIKPCVADNYRFLRRYFHPLWSWYVFFLRLVTFRNPFKECLGFFSQFRVMRLKLYAKTYDHHTGYKRFESILVRQSPKVSVIIPTLNRYPYLKDALHDLEKQDYKHFDVIIVDQSEPSQPDFYKSFRLDMKVIRQEEKALWLARNTAIQQSDAEYFLLYDDDSRTEPDWISQHLKCLDYFRADISSGVSISVVGAKVPANYSFFRWSDQLDTGNVMIKRDVFRKIGLFDRQFERQRQGDGEFGLRAYLAGFKNISNPYAKRLHLKVGEGGLRQMGSWDGFRPKSWLAPRPVPSVLYLVRKYFGDKSAVYSILIGVPPSLLPYRYKRNHTLLLIGSLLVLPLLPLVGWQVWKSWRMATQMLQNGAKINYLQHEKTIQNMEWPQE